MSISIDEERNINDKEDGYLMTLIDGDELSLISSQVNLMNHPIRFKCVIFGIISD
jgi:hypothetical protein